MKWFFLAFLSVLHADFVDEVVSRPIAFSVVREDSIQDVDVIRRYFPEDEISMLMVASGGCTAATLLADVKIKDLTLVDPNVAQLQLSKLKIQLLTFPPQKRLEILGYRTMSAEERKSILMGLMRALDIEKNTFGDLDRISETGLDFAGRYERVFEEIRAYLKPFESEIEALFSLSDVEEQARSVGADTLLGMALDRAFDKAMSQDNLTRIFGEKATANRAQDFSTHFVERARTYLASHLASKSPWMAHLFLGRFYIDEMFPWLSRGMIHCFPKISYFHGTMDGALEKCGPEQFHVIHLSNILDWLSEDEARKTLRLAYNGLKPGGCVTIRQLNSNLDIPSLGEEFEWVDAKSEDRSFFYRHFHLGFKRKASAAPQVTAMADQVLKEYPILDGAYFKALATMAKGEFQASQAQFFHAVDYFSRPMTVLVARLPLHKDRIDILHNIVEEHGDFESEKYHSNTFKQFLSSIGTKPDLVAASHVDAFNYTLMGVCANEDPVVAIAANGIIEYAFADISAHIGKMVVERGWVGEKDLVHYNLHANIDKRHAEELFAIVESSNPEKVLEGLRLGAYIFNRLYEDLYLNRSQPSY